MKPKNSKFSSCFVRPIVCGVSSPLNKKTSPLNKKQVWTSQNLSFSPLLQTKKTIDIVRCVSHPCGLSGRGLSLVSVA